MHSALRYSGFQLRSNFPLRAHGVLRNGNPLNACALIFEAVDLKKKRIRILLLPMSAEPNRKKAYTSDIRWRIVYQRMAMGLCFADIAKNLNIATSTACRTYHQFESTGEIQAIRHDSRPDLRVLNEHSELILIGIILNEPSIYLEELCQRVADLLTSTTVSPSTVCRTMRRYGITRKRIRQVALQRCNALCGTFMAQCSVFSRNQFIWVDETGSDKRDHVRKYGYAIRGTTPVSHRLLARGQRVNAIAALSAEGIVAVDLVSGSVNGEKFFDFLRGSLIPNMMPYDGQNPNSILVMDNCSVHHVHEVVDLIQQSGILLFFLPPYSPHLNPAEEAFSYIKGYLKKHDTLLQCGVSLTDVIQAGFDSITATQCQSWITRSGYVL